MKSLIYILLIALVSSCAPMSYTISVDQRVDSENNVDFQGKIPGVITIAQRGVTDSVYISKIGIGIAQKMEADLYLETGSVPVYFFYDDEVNIDNQGDNAFLHSYTGTDFIVVVDSLSIADFEMDYPIEKGYYDGREMCQSIISMPYRMNLNLYQKGNQGVEFGVKVDQMESWILMAPDKLPKVSALSKISDRLADSFVRIGEYAAEEFFPTWKNVNKRIYVYNNASWTQAYYYAYMFEWEKAMEIWLEEAQSKNTLRSGYAAHNISVACEILGMEELSRSWSEMSRKLLNY